MKKKHLYNKYLQKKLSNPLGAVIPWAVHLAPTKNDGNRGQPIRIKSISSLKHLNYRAPALQPTNSPKVPLQITKVKNFYAKQMVRALCAPNQLKFKYVGKSYRVKFKDNVIFLKFNRAHRTTLLIKNAYIEPFKRL